MLGTAGNGLRSTVQEHLFGLPLIILEWGCLHYRLYYKKTTICLDIPNLDGALSPVGDVSCCKLGGFRAVESMTKKGGIPTRQLADVIPIISS